jgi:hypothetical protein
MATYYIATTGNDTTGDGSSSNPWLTLQKFLDTSSDNDTLIVKDGTYTLTANVTISQRTIQAENNGLAIFDGGSTTKYIFVGSTNTFTGLIFQNFHASSANNTGIFTYSGTFGTTYFQNCTFKDNRLGYTTSSVRGPMFRASNAAVADNATFDFNTCLFHGNNALQSGATRGCYFGGINEFNSATYVNMTNCTFVENKTDGTYVPNMFYSQSANGFINVNFKNSIIYNSTGSVFNLVLNNNSIVSFTTTYSDYFNISDPNSPTIITGTGVITSDPLFIDPANNNYNLSPSSPCIDAGTLI